MEAGAGIERDLHPREVISIACGFGNQRIVAAWLIVGGGKQGVVQRIGAHRRVTAQGETVEVIKGADIGERHVTAFRRSGVHIIKMGKINGVFRFADNRKAVTLFNGLRLAGEGDKRQ